MRGLAILTLNSTYLFDDDQVMWVPNDRTRLTQKFGEDVMDASTWYTLARRPEMPTYDWANVQGTDMTPVSFTFSIYRFGEEPVDVPIVTSRVHNYVYLGDGESYKWRTDKDDLETVKAIVREHYDLYGAEIVGSRASVGRKIQGIKRVRTLLNLGLLESKNLWETAENDLLIAQVVVRPASDEALDELRRKLTGSEQY